MLVKSRRSVHSEEEWKNRYQTSESESGELCCAVFLVLWGIGSLVSVITTDLTSNAEFTGC